MAWVVNATPRPLYPWERPGTHCTGGLVDLRAGLDECGKSRPHRDSTSGPSSPLVPKTVRHGIKSISAAGSHIYTEVYGKYKNMDFFPPQKHQTTRA